MKTNIGRLVAAIGRVAAGAAKNSGGALATASTIALAVGKVVDGVAAIRGAIKKGN